MTPAALVEQAARAWQGTQSNGQGSWSGCPPSGQLLEDPAGTAAEAHLAGIDLFHEKGAGGHENWVRLRHEDSALGSKNNIGAKAMVTPPAGPGLAPGSDRAELAGGGLRTWWDCSCCEGLAGVALGGQGRTGVIVGKTTR